MNHITDADLIDYLHHELSDALDARVHAHLSGCRDCSARFEDEAALGDMLRSGPLGEVRDLPAMVRANVWAAVRASEPTFLERFRAFVSPAVAVPLAAMLALLLYLGIPVIRGGQAVDVPSVAATYYFEEHAAESQENPLADHNASAPLASGPANTAASAPLIDAAGAATLDDLVASRQ